MKIKYLIVFIMLFISSCTYTNEKNGIVMTDNNYSPNESSLIEENISIIEPINQSDIMITEENQISQNLIPPVSNYSLIELREELQEAEVQKENPKEIEEFIEWAENHKISLVGVNKSVNDFYYNGSDSEDFLDPKNVPNILQVKSALLKLPDEILKILKGKTLYLNHRHGRGYTVTGKWDDILKGIDQGAFIEQPISEVQVIHELGHIVDFNGIQGIYDEHSAIWNNINNLSKELFKVGFEYNPSETEAPEGFVDVYSTANEGENFAQHFMYYVLYPKEFRDKAVNDPLLKRKYDFFKDNLFNDKEY